LQLVCIFRKCTVSSSISFTGYSTANFTVCKSAFLRWVRSLILLLKDPSNFTVTLVIVTLKDYLQPSNNSKITVRW